MDVNGKYCMCVSINAHRMTTLCMYDPNFDVCVFLSLPAHHKSACVLAIHGLNRALLMVLDLMHGTITMHVVVCVRRSVM